MQPRLGLLKAPAAFQVKFVPRFISELKLFDLRHSLYTLRLFRGWVFLLPELPLFANTTYVFVCLVNVVYGRSNLHVSLRRFTMHLPSPVRLHSPGILLIPTWPCPTRPGAVKPRQARYGLLGEVLYVPHLCRIGGIDTLRPRSVRARAGRVEERVVTALT